MSTAVLELTIPTFDFDEQVALMSAMYVVESLTVDVALTPGSSSAPSVFEARESRDPLVGTDVVTWFGLEPIERYEPKEIFVSRLEQASVMSDYAKRLLYVLDEADEDTPVSLAAVQRAWDVLNVLPTTPHRVRVYPGDEGAVDMQLMLPDEVRLLTAGADGYYQSRRLVKASGAVSRQIHYGPAGAQEFLRSGGV